MAEGAATTVVSEQAARHRALWAAVVLQAREDVETEPLGSTAYDQAVAFFVGGGVWRDSRRAVADHLGLHPREIRAAGLGWIEARRQREGLPADPPQIGGGPPTNRGLPVVRTPVVEPPPRPRRQKPLPHPHGHVRADNPFAVYRLRPHQ